MIDKQSLGKNINFATHRSLWPQFRYQFCNACSRLADKPVSFEISLGNAGNSLDGQLQTVANTENEDGERSRN